MKRKSIGIVLALFWLSGCETPSSQSNVSGMDGPTINRKLAEAENPRPDDNENPFSKMVDAVVQRDSGSLVELGTKIRSMIQVEAFAQQLTASYDLYMDWLLSSGRHKAIAPGDFLVSELSCKLREASYFNSVTEESLGDLQFAFLKRRNQEAYSWFLGFFKSTKGDTPAQIMVKANLVRFLSNRHKENCSAQTCPEFPRFPGRPQAAFDLFNDTEMMEFSKKFASRIAIYSQKEIEAMPKGNCQGDGFDRQPNSDHAEYDWKLRNKTGRNLKPGEFIFTYDDGPHPKHTLALLDAWLSSGLAKPTFFWLGKNVKLYPAVARQVHDKGIEVAVHSFSHPDLGNLASASELAKLNKVNRSLFSSELASLQAADFIGWRDQMLEKQTIKAFEILKSVLESGAQIRRFRLPYGSGVRNARIGALLARLDVDHYFWDVDSLDWQDKNPSSIVEPVHKQMAIVKRGIILFHDIHPQSVEASKMLISELQRNSDKKVVNLNDSNL